TDCLNFLWMICRWTLSLVIIYFLLMGCMHTLNLVFLLLDTALNSLVDYLLLSASVLLRKY
ncbi:hypothetical protein BHE74_00042985, partial [Ensete ventricosum]